MTPSSQELESPGNPGRFSFPSSHVLGNSTTRSRQPRFAFSPVNGIVEVRTLVEAKFETSKDIKEV